MQNEVVITSSHEIKTSIQHILLKFIKQTQNVAIEAKNGTFSFSAKYGRNICTDKDRIYQVIPNLIHNSFKFAQTREIIMETELHSYMTMVLVKDSGFGIISQIVSRLFSRFSTSLHSSTSFDPYITKILIEKHGGKTWPKNNIDKVDILLEIPPITCTRDSDRHRKDTVNF